MRREGEKDEAEGGTGHGPAFALHFKNTVPVHFNDPDWH